MMNVHVAACAHNQVTMTQAYDYRQEVEGYGVSRLTKPRAVAKSIPAPKTQASADHKAVSQLGSVSAIMPGTRYDSWCWQWRTYPVQLMAGLGKKCVSSSPTSQSRNRTTANVPPGYVSGQHTSNHGESVNMKMFTTSTRIAKGQRELHTTKDRKCHDKPVNCMVKLIKERKKERKGKRKKEKGKRGKGERGKREKREKRGKKGEKGGNKGKKVENGGKTGKKREKKGRKGEKKGEKKVKKGEKKRGKREGKKGEKRRGGEKGRKKGETRGEKGEKG